MVLNQKVFRRSRRSAAIMPGFDDMSLKQVLAWLEGNHDPAFEALIQCYRRLIDIGLFLHGFDDDERDAALQMSEATRTALLALCCDRPEVVDAFESAAELHLQQARYYGYGSLYWLIEELCVAPHQLAEFLVQPEFADLLPDYLDLLSDDQLKPGRRILVQAMISARREHADQTDLEVLFELVAHTDSSIPFLMDAHEIAAIRGAAEDYPAALEMAASFT